MKKIGCSIFILTFCSVGFFISCKKTATTAAANLQMTADINGIPWRSYSSNISLDRSSSLHIIIMADSSNSHIRLDIGAYKGIGTYKFFDTANGALYTVSGDGHKASSGEIVITANDIINNSQTEIKGTFTFYTNNASIKDGIFDMKLYNN